MQLIMDSEGNIDVDLIEGVEKFSDKVLFIASECAKIGAEYQRKQMAFFPNTELVVIEESGHMMFGEKPVKSVNIVREYLKTNH